jgi:hypothetical protein
MRHDSVRCDPLRWYTCRTAQAHSCSFYRRGHQFPTAHAGLWYRSSTRPKFPRPSFCLADQPGCPLSGPASELGVSRIQTGRLALGSSALPTLRYVTGKTGSLVLSSYCVADFTLGGGKNRSCCALYKERSTVPVSRAHAFLRVHVEAAHARQENVEAAHVRQERKQRR